MEKAVHIRPAVPEDATALLGIYRPYVEETAITFEYETPTEEEFEARIRKTLARYPYLVAEDGCGIVGYAYAGPFKERAAYDWAVETTVYVDRARKRGGVGRALYEMLETPLAAQGILNLNACIGYPEAEDAYLTMDSVHFHRHLGYAMVGEFHRCGYKFGRWYDMVWMEKLIGRHEKNQPPVRPFCEIKGSLFR